jgi:hypothetical protein
MGLLASCATHKIKKPTKPAKRITENRHLADFSNVSIHGEINTVLKRIRRGSGLTIKGDTRDLEHVKTVVKNDRLYIVVEKTYPKHGALFATVSNVQLNSLQFQGVGSISGKNLRTSNMDIVLKSEGSLKLSGKIGLRKFVSIGKNKVNIKGITSRYLEVAMNGKPDIRLEGFANLREVQFAGEGDLSLLWVNSPDLLVTGNGKAKVHLAGVVRELTLNLYGHAEMDGQYLRVKKAYVKTYGESLARLQPIKVLNALASDKSNIYYYNSPEFKAGYMAENGAVLNYQPFWF